MTCEYCTSLIGEAETHCRNCGAPLVSENAGSVDFRSCPFCGRRLLALASPACNYCGRRLPDSYIKVREADLKRITEVRGVDETGDAGSIVEALISKASRREKRGQPSSPLGMFDITDLTDLFR